ncbi:MAG: hypothetical protein A3K76_06230 [Euryarchaeota archaeon RBG_13_57_23]|nr:MAG: hypothetical protein A3K76_06230 [Euryarchaeota archaeon RBG_13_57_23]
MGMVFGFSRKDARENEDPRSQKRVPYRLASYEHDVEGKRFKASNVVYSFWSASKYVLVLSLMLWWLPMFGQMIAGYVGGRRAGGPWKGVVASIIPVVAIWGVMTGFETGLLPSHMFGVAIAPAAIGAAINSDIPLLAPYFQFSSEYVGGFVEGLAGASPYGINYYVLTVAFAYVGGVLAAQNRREIEFTSGAVMNTTTVLVHDPSGYQQGVVEQGAPHGLLSGVGAFFHLPGGHGDRHSGTAARYSAHRHSSPWGRAAEMHYEDVDYGPRDPYMLPPGDFDDSRSGGMMSSRPTRVRKQKRRGAQNFSSKPRFNYQQYSYSQRQDPGYKGGIIRRNKGPSRFTVSPDAHSIKRAQKIIDNEWRGGHKSHGPSRFAEDFDDAEESESVAVEAPRRKEPHNGQWDSI